MLIAARQDQVLGFVGPVMVSPCGFADFDFIGVTPEERGRGIGTSLFHLCLQQFKDREARLFELITSVTNPAQRLYLDAGLRLVAVLVCLEKPLGANA